MISGRKHYAGPKDIDGLLALARHGLQKGEYVDQDLLARVRSTGEKTGAGKPIVKQATA